MLLFARLSLFAAVLALGCSDTDSNGTSTSSSGSSSSGEAPVVPPTPITWSAMSTTGAPAARYSHSAVWTGSKMIVWGGNVEGTPSVTNTGGVYDPATDTWTATSTTGAPAARSSHVAVWTGTKMLVWGGFGTTNLEAAGGIYDPATDTWAPMSTTGQPPLRTFVTAVWTGSKMIVWGGRIGSSVVATGGIYDPTNDTWTATNQAGAPSARFSHRASWSGKLMMVWGGQNLSDWLTTGALFDPTGASSGVWTTTTASNGAPGARETHTQVATEKSFIVWGGWNGGPVLNTGGILDQDTNTWTATSLVDAPSAREFNIGVWAGDHMLVWGGCTENLCETGKVLDDGGQFVPTSKGGEWFPVAPQAALSARYSATSVYTGSSIIVWGGRLDGQTRLDTGAVAPL